MSIPFFDNKIIAKRTKQPKFTKLPNGKEVATFTLDPTKVPMGAQTYLSTINQPSGPHANPKDKAGGSY